MGTLGQKHNFCVAKTLLQKSVIVLSLSAIGWTQFAKLNLIKLFFFSFLVFSFYILFKWNKSHWKKKQSSIIPGQWDHLGFHLTVSNCALQVWTLDREFRVWNKLVFLTSPFSPLINCTGFLKHTHGLHSAGLVLRESIPGQSWLNSSL